MNVICPECGKEIDMTDEYIPAKELARRNGLTIEMVRGRMARGWTFEEAINTPPQNTLPSVKDLAEEHGISADTVWMRLKNGWSLEDALCTPLIHPGRKYVLDVKAAAEKLGMTPGAVHKRLKAGWTLEEVVNTPKYKRRGSR